MAVSDKTKALRQKLARMYCNSAEGAITYARLRDVHQQAKQVLIDGPEFYLVVEALKTRAKFLGYTGDLGELYA